MLLEHLPSRQCTCSSGMYLPGNARAGWKPHHEATIPSLNDCLPVSPSGSLTRTSFHHLLNLPKTCRSCAAAHTPSYLPSIPPGASQQWDPEAAVRCVFVCTCLYCTYWQCMLCASHSCPHPSCMPFAFNEFLSRALLRALAFPSHCVALHFLSERPARCGTLRGGLCLRA